MGKTLTLGLLFGLWYLFNIQFNMRVRGGAGRRGGGFWQLALEGQACLLMHAVLRHPRCSACQVVLPAALRA